MSTATTGISSIPALTSEGSTAFQYRSTGPVASGSLTIPNRNGHRRTLLDVFFEPKTAGVFLSIQIGDRTFIRLPTSLGDFLGTIAAEKGVGMILDEGAKVEGKGLLWGLADYIPFDFPTAAQDESIIITPQAGMLSYGSIPGTYTISAYYLDQDTGDVVSKTVAGGTANPRKLYINDMTNSAAQPTAGRNLLDTVLTPSGLNGIADNMKQTAGLQTTGYVFVYDGSNLGTTTGGAADGKPTRLHIVDVDTELFTVETQEGLLVDRDAQNTLAYDRAILYRYQPKDPYVFQQNRNFRFQLDTSQKVGGGSNYAALTQYFAFIGIREPTVTT